MDLTIYNLRSDVCSHIAKELHEVLISADSRDFIAYHNAYADYTLALLLFSTGHRPVKDPFCFKHMLDEDSGLCLIDDKVSNERRRYRVGYLCDLARQQLQNYLQHLQSLSSYLGKNGAATLAEQLAGVLSGTPQKALPLFFRFGSTSIDLYGQSCIKQLFCRNNTVPGNINRRWLAILLSRQGAPGWLTASLLGHMESSVLPNGDFCRESQLEIRTLINEFVNPELTKSGWLAVKSSFRPQYALNRSVQTEFRLNRELGPIFRRKQREVRKRKVKELIKSFVVDIQSSSRPKDLKISIWYEETNAKLVELLHERRLPIKYALHWFCRYMSQHGPEDLKNKSTIWQKVDLVETSPWRELDIWVYKKAKHFREKLVELIDDLGRQSQDEKVLAHNKLLAIRTLSLALLTKVSSKQSLKFAQELGGELVESCGQYMLYFKELDCKTDYIGPLDSISAALSRQIQRHYPEKRRSTSVTQLSVVIDATGLKVDNLTGFKEGDDQSIYSALASQAQALLSFEASGPIRATSTGRLTSTSLNIKTLTRLSFSQPISVTDKTETLFNREEPSLSAIKSKDAPNELKEYLRSLHQAMSEQSKSEYVRKEKAKINNSQVFVRGQLSVHQTRVYLAEVIRLYRKNKALPQFGQLIAHWGEWLCTNKTRHGHEIEAKTVIKYSSLVVNKLKNISHEAVLFFEPEEWEAAYTYAIEGSSVSEMRGLTARFNDFHHYLGLYWRVPDVHWAGLYALANMMGVSGQVDANILTPVEYRRIQVYLHDDDHAKNPEYKFCSWMLFLGYRFGLRWSEAYYLTAGECYLEEDGDLYIRIKENDKRGLKTSSSRRDLELLEELSPEETNLINDYLQVIGIEQGGSPVSADYFCKHPHTARAYDEVRISRAINGLLKQVSGDQSLHYHHLRHGFVCRQWLSVNHLTALLPMLSEPLRSSSQTLSGCVAMRSVSDLMGHTVMSTTLHSYLHIISWVGGVNNNLSSGLSSYALAWLLEKNEAAVRKKRQRDSNKSTCSWGWLHKELASKNPTPPVAIQAITMLSIEKFLPSRPEPLSMEVVHDLLTHYALHDRNVEHTAKRFGVEQGSLEPVVKGAKEIELSVGYERFSINPQFQIASPKDFSILTEKLHVNRQLKKISAINSEAVRKASVAWQSAYHSGANEYFFDDYQGLLDFVTFINELGVDITGSEFYKRGTHSGEANQIALLNQYGVIECAKRSNYQKKSPGRQNRRRAVVLYIPRPSGALNSIKQVNRMMYIAAVCV